MGKTRRGLFAVAAAAVMLFGFIGSVWGDVYLATLAGVKGPSTGFTNGDLNGTYRFRTFEFEDFGTAGEEAFVGIGYATFNGAGGWTGSIQGLNSDGSADTDALSGTYSVNSDGSFTFTLAGGTPGHVFSGTISKDAGRSFLYMTLGADLTEFVIQSLVFAVKERTTAPNLSSLNGTYVLRTLGVHDFESINPDATANIAEINCNGSGNWSASYTGYNAGGASETGSVSGTYAVNGKSLDFRVTGETGVFLTADITPDGNVLVASSSSDGLAQGEQFIATMVKRNPAVVFSNASLNGTYKMGMMLLQDFGGNLPEAYIVDESVTFDGSGGFTAAYGSVSKSGTPFYGTGSGVYSVSSDGSFTLTVTSETPNQHFTGTISQDGQVLTGTRAEGGFSAPGELFLDLGSAGLYAFDGNHLEMLNPVDVQQMAMVEGGIAVGFPGYGVYFYDGSTWSYVIWLIPEDMIFWQDTLVMDFGIYGVYAYTGSEWIAITPVSPDCMAVWGDKLVLGFADYGLYTFDGTAWTNLTGLCPDTMTAWGAQLVLDFGALGVWGYQTANWTLITGEDPEDTIAWRNNLVMDFGGMGVWAYNGASWTPLPVGDPEAMLAWGDYLVLDYGAGGLYLYDLSSWELITSMNAEDMEVATFN